MQQDAAGITVKTHAKIPVVIDTREQTPWEFDDEMFDPRPGTLITGDYSVLGLTDTIAIERKSLGDFVGTVVHEWHRFRRELNRMGSIDHPLIVVECDVSDIIDHKYESDASPASVIGRMNGIMLDHGIPVVCWGRRATAIAVVERWLIQVVKKCGVVP